MVAQQSNVTANETPMSPPKEDTNQTNKKEEQSVIRNIKKYDSINVFLIVCIVGVILCKGLEIFNVQSKSNVPVCIANDTRSKYWLFLNPSEKEYVANEKSKHTQSVLRRLGYVKSTNETPWDLLWSMPCPFYDLDPHLDELKPHQRVNHFPGIFNLTIKVKFSIIESKYKPKAFQLPEHKEGLLKYASENPKALFLEKNIHHRGVVLNNLTEMNMEGDKFAQEFLPNPLFVDGYVFEVGVYVAITSVQPLRVYYYSGDILFRYCLEKYHPFDPLNERKYVVGDNYRYSSQVPALARLHSELGLGMKEAFDVYIRYQGKDPAKMWTEMQKAIREIFLNVEQDIIGELQFYASKHNFFEMLRVDFMVDEDMNVYLLEVNKGPSLFSSNAANELLYDQVLYSLFSLVGLSGPMRNYLTDVEQQDCGTNTTDDHHAACMEQNAAAAMFSADKNIAVFGDECNSSCTDCEDLCILCLNCLPSNMRRYILHAYREHLHRGDFKRIFPPAMTPHTVDETLDKLTPFNHVMSQWYQGKCNQDVAWCT